ncbi:hypothetical protein FACS189451_03850 [Bacteroidia bacterium]|nr:hypothetical protein FACS189446_1650 [Bacteroidia bacterium]GHT61563.1 hypothetical protein FACS189451_03850 [Bacteroidia bacterium]
MNINEEELGNRIKELRKIRNLSQKELAEQVGLTQGKISRLEAGKIGTPTLISVLQYFSKFIYIDLLFSEHFVLFENSKFNKSIHLNSIMIEKMEILKTNMNDKINEYINYFNKEMNQIIKLANKN